MPRLIALVMLVLASEPALSAAPPTPYRAMVQLTSTEVLSGPGPQYYATDELKHGVLVEVHQAAGPFLAIRPPAGSYSLVPAADIQLHRGSDVGLVQRAGLASRVGSSLTADASAVHVRLEPGERVRVLEEVNVDDMAWLKIAPPAGEFRWIRSDAVTPVSQIVEQPPVEPLVLPTEVSPPTMAMPPAKDSPQAEEPSDQTLQELEPQPAEPREPAAFVAEATPLQQWVDPVVHEQPTSDGEQAAREVIKTSPAPTTPPPSSPPPITSNGADRLRTLEVELARRVSGPANHWQLADLQQEVTRLYGMSTDAAWQARVQSLSDRLNRFSSLAERYRRLSGSRPTVALTKSPVTARSAPAIGASQMVTGELRQVVSRTKQPGAPEFALIDPRGQVLTFVTPQPGMDLTTLIGKQVSVTGTQGYLPSIRRQSIAATRVAQLPPNRSDSAGASATVR